MSNTNPMIGPSFLSQAREVEKQRDAKAAWPYEYIYPPPNAIDVAVGMGPTVPGVSTAGVAMPANGAAQAVVMQYQVPNGFTFWLQAVIAEVAKAAQAAGTLPFAAGDGSAFWTLDVDQDIGQTFPAGEAVKDFQNVQMQLGCWELGRQFPLRMPEPFQARHILRWKFTNVSQATYANYWCSAGLFGFLVKEGS